MSKSLRRPSLFALLMAGLAGSIFLASAPGEAVAQKKQFPFKDQARKPLAQPAPRSALLTPEAWQNAPLAPISSSEIDLLVAKELQTSKVEPARLTTDEQFIRRVTLDLTGQLPEPADVTEFVATKDSRKRAKLIDKLLDSDDYARHWARYWRDVVSAKLPDRRTLLMARGFEDWLYTELKSNKSWGDITRAILTAEGEFHFDKPEKNGVLYFLVSHRGAEAASEIAAETARIFLGIQIQCAQCHDHPSDQWKRVQFHELAAYFARVNQRPIREKMQLTGLQLVTLPRAEHEMPSKEDPKKSFVTLPRFLDGHTPPANSGDKERRRSLASDITDKKNYWFAAAHVNRLWGELMGQSFYQPVDDLGPQKEAVFPTVLTRLTGAFRGTNYDIKDLFRSIMNSETYQRQIRLGESSDQHLHFAAAYPTRLRADALWESLNNVLGRLTERRDNEPKPAMPIMTMFRRMQGLEFAFKSEFDFDPSLKADEVEGSIPQALLMMNNPQLQQKIQAQGTNLLGRLLKSYPQDDEALRMLYLRTLARKPTDRELVKCREFIQKTGNRTEAFEDLLWALLNSTEFQTKR